MIHRTQLRHPRSRTLIALVAVAALAALACDEHVYHPTAPNWQNFSTGGAGARTLEFHASLTAEGGAILQATLLYDGVELPGALTTCPRAGGCASMWLEGSTTTSSGHHTMSIQVLDQSPLEVGYLAEGFVRITRENVSLPRLELALEPSRAVLRPGQSVDFDLEFSD